MEKILFLFCVRFIRSPTTRYTGIYEFVRTWSQRTTKVSGLLTKLPATCRKCVTGLKVRCNSAWLGECADSSSLFGERELARHGRSHGAARLAVSAKPD